MRGRYPIDSAVQRFRQFRYDRAGVVVTRGIRISPTPTIESPTLTNDAFGDSIEASNPIDARFEVLGAPHSLLSVSLSASQNLYTRKGTLVGVTGKLENTRSTLSILEPFRRLLLGIPFLYQRISSTTPINALLSTKSPLTSFTVLHLNGTVDWTVAQRKALLAWTGHNLSVSPIMNRKWNLAYWGNTEVTGRGLVALAGQGNVYSVSLKAEEEFIAHPANVVAYTITQHPPQPYRFPSSLRFQIPNAALSKLLPDIQFFRIMRQTATWRRVGKMLFSLRTALRRSIWGDRLFMKFRGPTTILISSRACRTSDMLTARDVKEMADTEAGVVQATMRLAQSPRDEGSQSPKAFHDAPTAFHVANVGPDSKVQFRDVDTKLSTK